MTQAKQETPLLARLRERFAPVERIEAIAPDASVRRFFRLHRPDGSSAILLVDGAGGPEAVERMARVQALLAAIGVPVPELLDRDDTIPALLFEDLGDRLLADALPELPERERRRIYAEAAEIAAAIAVSGTERLGKADPLRERPLARERLRIELAMFATHDVAGRRRVTDRALLTDLGRLLDRIASEAAAAPAELAHRDLHARNIVLRDGGSLGLLDFQDALLAPRHYDLASLLYDPYVELEPELQREAAERYRSARGFALGPLSDPRFAWVALQRLLKAIGTYAFQARRAGRERFLASIAPAERRALALCERLAGEIDPPPGETLRRIGFGGA